MKKVLVSILVATAVISASALSAFAVSQGELTLGVSNDDVSENIVGSEEDVNESTDAADEGKGSFVDEDGDGVCDNKPARDECDKPNKGEHKGERKGGFVDEDGDGVCDNKPARDECDKPNKGEHKGEGKGGFVDEDGDGVCDNKPARGERKGRGIKGETVEEINDEETAE